jgi:hypothetical protein
MKYNIQIRVYSENGMSSDGYRKYNDFGSYELEASSLENAEIDAEKTIDKIIESDNEQYDYEFTYEYLIEAM